MTQFLKPFFKGCYYLSHGQSDTDDIRLAQVEQLTVSHLISPFFVKMYGWI